MTRAVIDDLREHAEELGCERELASLGELVESAPALAVSSTGSSSTATCAA